MALREKIGSADLDWGELGFHVQPVAGHMRCVYRDGKWGEPEFVEKPTVELPVTANVLHYGQACFEGLKAFANAEGVAVFNDSANQRRLAQGSERLVMPHADEALWKKMVDGAIRGNLAYVPPADAPRGCALYLRPVLFGSGAGLGVAPSNEATLLVIAVPVSSYYKADTGVGASNGDDSPLPPAIAGKVIMELDRAAPHGVGHVKAAGNYAADLLCQATLKKDGIPIGLYLDAREKRFVEEFNTSNFVGILPPRAGTKGPLRFVTPDSSSILRSTTNACLQRIAKDILGMEVEVRPVDFFAEIDQFLEVGAVGTAVVIQPIKELLYVRPQQIEAEMKVEAWKAPHGSNPPSHLTELYRVFTRIQRGERSDDFGWLRQIDLS